MLKYNARLVRGETQHSAAGLEGEENQLHEVTQTI